MRKHRKSLETRALPVRHVHNKNGRTWHMTMALHPVVYSVYGFSGSNWATSKGRRIVKDAFFLGENWLWVGVTKEDKLRCGWKNG